MDRGITLVGGGALLIGLADRIRAETGMPVWLAALTHPGEDEIVLEAFGRLTEEFPGLLLVLVPRHPVRTDDIAAMIDSRDFLDARLRQKAAALLPEGTRILFTGGADVDDHRAIWDALDRARDRHPDMILLHGATPTGAERIAACWAETRKVTQVAFRPDWSRHGKSAPFKRNDRMLEALPVGVIIFPGTGIQDNLADKAAKIGLPVWDFRKRGR